MFFSPVFTVFLGFKFFSTLGFSPVLLSSPNLRGFCLFGSSLTISLFPDLRVFSLLAPFGSGLGTGGDRLRQGHLPISIYEPIPSPLGGWSS